VWFSPIPRVDRKISPRPRDMAIFTLISSNHQLTIIMELESPSQTEGRVQVPSLLARAKGAIYINPISIRITNGSPHPGPLEVVEKSPK